MVLHQLCAFAPEILHEKVGGFLASSWVDPRTEQISFILVIGSLVESAMVGMFGLLLFCLRDRNWRPQILLAFSKSAKNGIALVAASACVGIIIESFSRQELRATSVLKSSRWLRQTSSCIARDYGLLTGVGHGSSSVVCYLLMATLMGSVLGELGVLPLIAHLFIFYFGMMSMVTPPALAGYAV